MFTHPSLLGLGNVFTKSLRNQLGLHVVTVWLGKQALPLVVIIPYDQSCNWKQEPGWGKQGTIDLGVLGSQRAERRQLLSCNAKAWVSAFERKGGRRPVRLRENLTKGLEWERTQPAVGEQWGCWSSMVWGGKTSREARWAPNGTFVKGGEQVVILIQLGLSFCPPSGPSSLWSQQGHCFPSTGLCFTGENVVFVPLRFSIQVLPWWRQAGEGLRGRIQPLAAEGQGPPLSPFLRPAWVAQSSQNPLARYKSRCVGGGEGILGKQLQLLYF